MAARNDITGDVIATKSTSTAYRDNYDAIFRKPKEEPKPEPVLVVDEPKPEVDHAVVERQKADALRMRWYKYIEKNQRTLKSVPSFQDFFDNILPTLPPEKN